MELQKQLEKYTEKKISNLKLKELMSDDMLIKELNFSDKLIRRVYECGDFMKFLADEKLEKFKLEHSNNCRNRFCPRCSYLKSRKDAIKLLATTNYLSKEENKQFIFLTLTVPNCLDVELESTIKLLNDSFKRMFKLKRVKSMNKGYLKKIEITYNKKENTYHPHIHTLIVVNKSYFTDTKLYIKRDEWLEMWQNATGIPQITQVDVRKIKNNSYEDLLEIVKYNAKDSDYLGNGADVFKIFYKSLKSKRLFVSGGLIKDCFNKFDNNELENYLEEESIEYVYKIFATWEFKSNKYITKLEKI